MLRAVLFCALFGAGCTYEWGEYKDGGREGDEKEERTKGTNYLMCALKFCFFAYGVF